MNKPRDVYQCLSLIHITQKVMNVHSSTINHRPPRCPSFIPTFRHSSLKNWHASSLTSTAHQHPLLNPASKRNSKRSVGLVSDQQPRSVINATKLTIKSNAGNPPTLSSKGTTIAGLKNLSVAPTAKKQVTKVKRRLFGYLKKPKIKARGGDVRATETTNPKCRINSTTAIASDRLEPPSNLLMR